MLLLLINNLREQKRSSSIDVYSIICVSISFVPSDIMALNGNLGRELWDITYG